jgi:hypothetical protein
MLLGVGHQRRRDCATFCSNYYAVFLSSFSSNMSLWLQLSIPFCLVSVLMLNTRPIEADTYIYAVTDIPWPNAIYNTAGTARLNYILPGHPALYTYWGHEWYDDGQWKIGWFCGANAHASHAVMQNDGNFVTYDQNWVPQWETNTDGNPGAFAALQDDMNFVIYTAQGSPLWSMFDFLPSGCYY